MLLYTLKYLGSEPTRVRLERGGEKVEVQPNEEVQVQETQAKALLSAYPNLFASMGSSIDEAALDEKRKKAAAANLKLSERQALADKKAAEKAAASAGEAAPSGEAVTYEAVQEMDMVALAKLNDSKKLGLKITKTSKVEAVRNAVCGKLKLEPAKAGTDMETFKKMIDNRTAEQLAQMVLDIDAAVEPLAEEDREEAKEYIVAKDKEMNPAPTGEGAAA